MTQETKHTPTPWELHHCGNCKQTKSLASFSKSERAKSGLQTYCKSCMLSMARANPESAKSRRVKYTSSKPAESMYHHISRRAKKHSIAVMSREDFCVWYYSQVQECVYCAISQAQAKEIYSHALHIDRKEGKLGYVATNVCFACQRCNLIKNGYLTHRQMMEIAGRYFGGPFGNAHEGLVDAATTLEKLGWFAEVDCANAEQSAAMAAMRTAIAKARGEA